MKTTEDYLAKDISNSILQMIQENRETQSKIDFIYLVLRHMMLVSPKNDWDKTLEKDEELRNMLHSTGF